MNRQIAKHIHESTNSFYWMENPEWDAGSKVGNFVCSLVRAFPVSIHELQKKSFFAYPEKIIVSGESVVVDEGDMVNKFMFRYPSKMSTEQFFDEVKNEISTVIGDYPLTTSKTEVVLTGVYLL